MKPALSYPTPVMSKLVGRGVVGIRRHISHPPAVNGSAGGSQNTLIRWLKNTFSESYSGWIHLKAIRVFVESILRYGLPPNFVAILFNVCSCVLISKAKGGGRLPCEKTQQQTVVFFQTSVRGILLFKSSCS